MTGIKPKQTKGTKHFDETAKRYVMYPLHNLNLATTQAISPVWNPKMPKGRFVLLEVCEYLTQVVDETAGSTSNGITLGEKIMGTDAQVSFLMGESGGTGYMDKGMTYLSELTNVNPSIAVDVESQILPTDAEGNIFIPDNLHEFKKLVEEKEINDSPIREVVEKTKIEVLEGINRAIRYCETFTANLENEIANAKLGRSGIKSIETTQKFYFNAIGKSLPEDREGTNMGSELTKSLAPLIQALGGTNIPVADTREKDAEIEVLKRKLEDAEKTNTELLKELEGEEE